MNIRQAYLIAKLAHKGQKYGDKDYFEGHVEQVVRRCEAHPHCVYGHVVVAYLHDVAEDTDLDVCDLRDLGLDERLLDAVDAITRRPKQVGYAYYLTRVLRDPIATFVKYHDLQENLSNCLDLHATHPIRGKSRHNMARIRKYDAALQRIRASRPFWYYE